MADPRAPSTSQIHPGASVSSEYTIASVPDLIEVTTGAQVEYQPLFNGTTNYPIVINGLRDGFRWYAFADRAILRNGDGVPLTRGPFGVIWQHKWTSKPGRYVVGCQINIFKEGKRLQWAFINQRIVRKETVLARMMFDARKNGHVQPDEAVQQVARMIENLKIAAEKFEMTADTKKKFEEDLKKREDYLAKLNGKLASTKNLVRIPFHAVHLSTASQQQIQLTAFIAKVRTIPPEQRETPRGVVSVPEQQLWKLVDYTDPTLPQVCQEVEAQGETDEKAIRNLIDTWNNHGNRYPDGTLRYEITVGGMQIKGEFETNGKTTLDWASDLLGYIAMAGLAVVGVATLVAPVPGSRIVSAAIWSAILSSTAAAAINIYQRHTQNFGTWKDDAIDGLTIVGNLLAGVGIAARVGVLGSQAGWARGATLKMADSTGKTVKYVLIGQVANDGIQGILVLDKEMEEYDKIMGDKTMAPDERHRRLMAWLQRLGFTGLMTYINVRSTKADLKSLKEQNKYLLKPGKKTDDDTVELWDDVTEKVQIDVTTKLDTDDLHAMTTQEKLDKLADPKTEIEMTKPTPVEGHTKDGKSKTTAHTEADFDDITDVYKRQFTFDERFPPDPDIWRHRKISDNEILLQRKLPGHEHKESMDVVFHATCKNGYIHVEIVMTYQTVNGSKVYTPELNAKELYPMMFHHFETVAARTGKPIKGIKGEFAFDNYDQIYAQVKDRIPPDGAIPHSSLQYAKTWKYWQDYIDDYNYRLVPLRDTTIKTDHELVYWAFKVEPK